MSEIKGVHDIGIASPFGVGNDSPLWLMYCTCGEKQHRGSEEKARIAGLAHSIKVQQAPC